MSEARRAVVTGAAGGIGAAIASCLHEHGWTVVGTDRVPPRQPDDFDSFFQCDLSQTDAVEDLGRKLSGLGATALINNAAVQTVGPGIEITDQEWDATLAVNLRAPMSLMKALLLDSKNLEVIVNIGSVHALASSEGMAAYAASKAALVTLTKVMALELGPRGIRVNSVLPGAVDTDMFRAGVSSRNADVHEGTIKVVQAIPLRRLGRARDVAESVRFLIDPSLSGYITGHALVVDGGVLARLSSE